MLEDIWFGADVIPTDGGTAGELLRAVYDPATWEVVALVVQHAGFGSLSEVDMLVPIGLVSGTEFGIVDLTVTQEQFDQLEPFADARNVAPPPDRDHSADLDEELMDVPDVPPVGAATGVESIAFTPIIEESTHVPAYEGIVDGRSIVWATDGEAGRLVAISIDGETRRLRTILVRRGSVFTKDAPVPIEWVADVNPETIVLNVNMGAVDEVTPKEL
jgi:hypothetical protein